MEALLDVEVVAVADVDPAACTVLSALYPDVPNLGDIKVIDWSPIGPVDVLTAGYPCQPFSTAGRRQGVDDERHLWPFVADAIGVLRPRLVFLENVAGHLSLGFDVVLADLAALGYDATWCVVRASDVGACHGRARLFVLARPADAERGRRNGRARVQGRGEGPRAAPERDSQGPIAWGAYEPAIRRHELVLGRPAPHPVDRRGRLNPVFVEWMQMLEPGWVTDLITSRSACLKLLGNGVCPPQAVYAFAHLLERSTL